MYFAVFADKWWVLLMKLLAGMLAFNTIPLILEDNEL